METDPYDNTPRTPDQPKRSAFRRATRGSGGWLRRHPVGALQIVLVILLVIIVLQNLEPTSIDVLFWTVAQLPKLVVIIISMVLGALLWEWIRRRWLKPGDKPHGATTTNRTHP